MAKRMDTRWPAADERQDDQERRVGVAVRATAAQAIGVLPRRVPAPRSARDSKARNIKP